MSLDDWSTGERRVLKCGQSVDLSELRFREKPYTALNLGSRKPQSEIILFTLMIGALDRSHGQT